MYEISPRRTTGSKAPASPRDGVSVKASWPRLDRSSCLTRLPWPARRNERRAFRRMPPLPRLGGAGVGTLPGALLGEAHSGLGSGGRRGRAATPVPSVWRTRSGPRAAPCSGSGQMSRRSARRSQRNPAPRRSLRRARLRPPAESGLAPIAVIETPISTARKRTSRSSICAGRIGWFAASPFSGGKCSKRTPPQGSARFMDHGLSTALNASDCRDSSAGRRSAATDGAASKGLPSFRHYTYPAGAGDLDESLGTACA
jgi:hypothetical protein